MLTQSPPRLLLHAPELDLWLILRPSCLFPPVHDDSAFPCWFLAPHPVPNPFLCSFLPDLGWHFGSAEKNGSVLCPHSCAFFLSDLGSAEKNDMIPNVAWRVSRKMINGTRAFV